MADPVVPVAPVVPDSPTIVTAPPPAPPAAPDTKLFVEQPKPAEPASPAAPASPETPAPVTTPATPVIPEAPKEAPKADATPATPKPPEEELKLPDGSLLSADDLAEIKAKNLSKEQAETLLKSEDAAVKRYADRQAKVIEQAKSEWKNACESDPVIGGEKYAENVALAQRGFRAIADSEVTKFLVESGLGNHPMAVRMFAKLGKMIAEDRIIPGMGGNNPAKKNPEDVLYGKPPVTTELH